MILAVKVEQNIKLVKNIEKYVNEYLSAELNEFKNSPFRNNYSHLSIFEKTIIYKYTEDGFRTLNTRLRENNAKYLSKYGRFLKYVLEKLPNYQGIVYRGVDLNRQQINFYKNAYVKNQIITETTFTSTSKSKLIANMYGNTTFIILSKHGRSIEELSKYGPSQNEREVLFVYKTRFNVLELTKLNNKTLIKMEEV